jgi:hypothetical protein
LLDRHAIVDGDVRLEEVEGRNLTLRVDSSVSDGFFLKQARPDDAAGAVRIGVEAELYARVNRVERGSPLRAHIPRFARYDADRALLVIELLSGWRSPCELTPAGAEGGVPAIGLQTGVALAACHATFLDADRVPGEADFLDRAPPWFLEMIRPPTELLREVAPAQVELLAVIQERTDICSALDEVRREWSATSLIHGDIKWPNMLVRIPDDSDGAAAVRLIDWECAQWGDPAWDVASAFHSMLIDCIEDASVTAFPDAAAGLFIAALPAARREMQALWGAYARQLNIERADAITFLDRAAHLCAVRLMQFAYEAAAARVSIPRISVGALQLGFNMLQRPALARRAVLGFPD